MNAAVSASVVLASRLCTDVAVFALALFSVQAFALFPMLRQRLQTSLVAVWLFFNNVHGRFSSVFARLSVTNSDVAGSLHVILYYPHRSYHPNLGPEVQEYNSRPMGRSGAKSQLKLLQE